MQFMKTWLRDIIKYIFQTQFRNLICGLILFFIKNNFNRKYIDIILGLFNKLSRKTNFHFVEPLELTSNEKKTVAYVTQGTLCAARPQFYYQNFDLTEVKKQNFIVLKLTGAKIIGSSNIVLVSLGKALYEHFFYDEYKEWDYTDTSIYKYIGKSFLLQFRDSKKVISRGIMFSGNYSGNYYHFLYEFLTKFFLVDKLDLPKDIPLIVDDVVEHIPQYLELLKYFNRNEREVIFIKSGNCYEVETLYYPPLINLIPPNFKNIGDIKFADCLFNLSSITYLRDMLLPSMGTTNSKKRIFLSRRNASLRRSYNESEVITIFEKYDFQIICPEDYDIAEQMYVFNNADFIVGVTGAAFTNILFCNCGCKILCITPTENELSVFSTISKHLGLNLQYLAAHGTSYKAEGLHDNFAIDLDKIENVLDDFLRR